MSVLQGFIGRLAAGNHLNAQEISASVEQLIDETISPNSRRTSFAGWL